MNTALIGESDFQSMCLLGESGPEQQPGGKGSGHKRLVWPEHVSPLCVHLSLRALHDYPGVFQEVEFLGGPKDKRTF